MWVGVARGAGLVLVRGEQGPGFHVTSRGHWSPRDSGRTTSSNVLPSHWGGGCLSESLRVTSRSIGRGSQ